MENQSIWLDLLSVCKERGLDPMLITFPERFRDHQNTVKRAKVLSVIRTKGWSINAIMGLCPMSERGIRKAVNGNEGASIS